MLGVGVLVSCCVAVLVCWCACAAARSLGAAREGAKCAGDHREGAFVGTGLRAGRLLLFCLVKINILFHFLEDIIFCPLVLKGKLSSLEVLFQGT